MEARERIARGMTRAQVTAAQTRELGQEGSWARKSDQNGEDCGKSHLNSLTLI